MNASITTNIITTTTIMTITNNITTIKGESKSKQEEDRIITDEVVYLKKAVPDKNTNKKKMKELVVRAIYVEMLGQDASFTYIKAVELCASTNIFQKRVGYLASSLCISPDHEFRFMLVNQIQKDMNSTNQLEACAALNAVCKIVTVDMIPAVIGEIFKLLRHDMDTVRKKAICALHRLYQMDKTCIIGQVEQVRRILCDKDPSVMGACLPFLYNIAQDDTQACKDLVPSLVSILKQITEHRLPRDFDYHRIPAPWIQMNILRILAVIGRGDQPSSEGMYEVLIDVMKRADTGINVGYALVYEVVRTVTTIYPNPILLDAAATAISRFIRSESHNLKYIGIKGLATIVKDHPKYAADHQMAVIDCLDDPDETLKRKTLDLLFRMTNAINVEFIVEKLLSFLSAATDDHFRTDLVGQITQCAERFAPSNAWYTQTIVKVFELAGDKVKSVVAQTLMQLIAEGQDDSGDDVSDDELRAEIVENFLVLIEKPILPNILAQCIAWVLGEYGYLSVNYSKEQIMEKLCSLMHRSTDEWTKGHIVSALMKLVAQAGSCPIMVTQIVKNYTQSSSLDVQQRCLEFQALLLASATMADVLPVDASCEDIEVDKNLGFLNNYVQTALSQGAAPYSPPQVFHDDDDEASLSKSSGLNITPYQKPTIPQSGSVATSGILAGLNIQTPSSSSSPAPASIPTGQTQGNNLLNTRGVTQVWGKKAELPPPQSTPQAVHSSAAIEPSPILSAPITPVTVLSPTPSVPEGPRELTAKEKQAQALFAGIGGTSKSTVAASKRKSVDTTGIPSSKSNEDVTKTPTTSTTTTSNNILDLDLLGMDSVSSALPVPNMSPIAPLPPVVPVQSSTHEINSPIAPTSIADVFANMTLSPQPSNVFNSVVPLSTGSRPLPLTTNEFGMKWGEASSELKKLCPCKVSSLEQLRSSMPPSFAHVESIPASAEAIYAATSSSNSNILVHVKIESNALGCSVTVRSSTRDICNSEISSISDYLSLVK